MNINKFKSKALRILSKINPKFLDVNKVDYKNLRLEYVTSKYKHIFFFKLQNKPYALVFQKNLKPINFIDCYLTLNSYGVEVPRIYYFPSSQKFCIMEWYPGENLGDYLKVKKCKKVLKECAKTFAKLHSIKLKVNMQSDVTKLKNILNAKISMANKKIINKYCNIVGKIFPKNEIITFSLIHGDAHKCNLIVLKNKTVKLIDFHGIYYGDPMFDLDFFLTDTNLSEKEKKYFLKYYLKFVKLNEIEKGIIKRVGLYKDLFLFEKGKKHERDYITIPLHRLIYYKYINDKEIRREFGYIQITKKCNRSCIFCSDPEKEGKDPNFLILKKQILDLVKDGVKEIVFTGGEPTISNNLAKLVKFCNTNNIQCRIITNAQKLANESYAKFLGKIGLKKIMISICSHKKSVEEKLTNTPGSYENTLKGIRNAIKYVCIPDINITVTSLNVNHLLP
ncbi:MAG: radical SAM protein, partial [Candidatus Helarchaeota archaeon]